MSNSSGRSDTVDEYLRSLPPDRQQRFTEVRDRVHAAVPGLGETISYKMPAFTHQGDIVLFAAAWKQHIGLYPVPRFDEPLESRVAPLRAAKDTVRLLHRQPVPDGVVEDIMAEVVARHERHGSPQGG